MPVNIYRSFVLFSQIVHELKRLARLNESLAQVFTLGKTYENKTMHGIKVRNKTGILYHMFLLVASCGRYLGHLKQTTTATATRTWRNRRCNEEQNGWAHAF